MFLDELDEEDYEIAIKVVIVGNGAVGKSSMIQRYCKGIFTKNYKKTIGVDFLEKHITASGEDVRLMLWDTAGQEEFDAITKAYYRGAQACVVAFSTTDRASFDAVKKWKRKVEDECGHIPMVLVQNKIDLLHESQVDNHEIEKFVRNTGLKLFRTSVKENLNVAKVFQHLSERHVEAVSRWSDEADVLQIGAGANQRDVRVRFSSSTENLDGSGSGSSNNSLSYFHSRLFPLSASTKRLNRVNKKHLLQQQQQQHAHAFFAVHPLQQQQQQQRAAGGGMGGVRHFGPLASFPPDDGGGKTIVLNPFKRAHKHRHASFSPQQHIHQSFPNPAPSKPSCRVL